MAASDVDQKVLARVARETAYENPLLSSALYQVLGISILLSRKLYRARRLRRLDPTRETKSISLYHHIIWLSREGLSIIEVLVLPYCQDGEQGPHCRVMAAKLRASFYHVFCLFHNHPPISQLSPVRHSPRDPLTFRTVNGQTVQRLSPNRQGQERLRKASLRDAIPSIASESSYVTNPFAVGGAAQTPPPSLPLPPTPKYITPLKSTPLRPPGLNFTSPTQRSPPSSADFLLPPINFIPTTTSYFLTALKLAKSLLSGSDPLALSVALEFCAFLRDCAKDSVRARQRAKSTLHDVFIAKEPMDDAEFQDAAVLVSAITIIAQLEDTPPGSNSSRAKTSSSVSEGTTSSPSIKDSNTEARGKKRSAEVSEDPRSRKPAPYKQSQPAKPPSNSKAAASRSSATAVDRPGQQNRGGTDRYGSEKERKRSLVERAEQQYMRRNVTRTTSNGRTSRQSTPPQMIAGQQGRHQ